MSGQAVAGLFLLAVGTPLLAWALKRDLERAVAAQELERLLRSQAAVIRQAQRMVAQFGQTVAEFAAAAQRVQEAMGLRFAEMAASLQRAMRENRRQP